MARSRCCDYILTCLFLPWVQTCAPRQYNISLSPKQQQHHLQHQQYLCQLWTRCQGSHVGQPWLQAAPQELELKIIWNKSKHYGLIEHQKIFNFFIFTCKWLTEEDNKHHGGQEQCSDPHFAPKRNAKLNCTLSNFILE